MTQPEPLIKNNLTVLKKVVLICKPLQHTCVYTLMGITYDVFKSKVNEV